MINVVLRPQRDLDLKGASLLQQRVYGLLPEEHTAWVIDLIEVNLINHFGLTALMAVRRLAMQHHCSLYLLNLKPAVRYMFDITELATKFDYLDSLDSLAEAKIRLLLC